MARDVTESVKGVRATDVPALASLVISLGKRAEMVHPAAAEEVLRGLRFVPPR